MAMPTTRLRSSPRQAVRGRELAALLDYDTPVPGVTEGALRPEVAAIAVPTTTSGHNMSAADFALTAGWGHFGSGQAVMPGRGRAAKRPFTADEQAGLSKTAPALGDTTFDIYMNDVAYWRNVPRRRLDLQTRRLPGPQKVALIPGTESPRPRPDAGGGPTLHGHRPAYWGDIGGDGIG